MEYQPRSHRFGSKGQALPTEAFMHFSKDHLIFAFREVFEQLSFEQTLIRKYTDFADGQRWLQSPSLAVQS